MKRISGGQLSLGANATLLSSHAGGPRAATGDTSFAGQAKQSTQQSRVSPPPAREPTGQAGRHRPDPKDDDSDSSLGAAGASSSRSSPVDSVQLDRHCARAWWRAALLLSGGRRRRQLVRPDGNLAFIKSATLATARERS